MESFGNVFFRLSELGFLDSKDMIHSLKISKTHVTAIYSSTKFHCQRQQEKTSQGNNGQAVLQQQFLNCY